MTPLSLMLSALLSHNSEMSWMIQNDEYHGESATTFKTDFIRSVDI